MKKILFLLFPLCAAVLASCASTASAKPITDDTKLSAVLSLPEIEPVARYLFYMKDDSLIRFGSHFAKMKDIDPNGNARYGLERLREVLNDGSRPISVYTDEECADDSEKRHAHILYFPPKEGLQNSTKPFVIVIAGGAYAMVSNLSESYPVARKFNELGYPVFALNYRIENERGLFPKPMEDLAHALRYIYAHHADFGLAEHHPYIVGGFSAGGHISAEWGTDNEGFLKYGLPAPAALFLGYAAISPKYFVSDDEKAMTAFRQSIVGKPNTAEKENRFSADQHIHPLYPPTYIVYCADDTMVAPIHSRSLAQALEEQHIARTVDECATGGHGFAVGFGTSAEGWIERADQFFMEMMKLKE